MIKIRYADLPGGLHVRAVARGKDTVIYLLPGLTAEQRQAALRRARSSGRMGQGPRLPAAGVAGAVMVDRIRATVRNGAAAMLGHPAIFVPPILIIVTAAVAYLLLVSVSIRIHEPQASEPGNPIPAAAAPPPEFRALRPAPRPTHPASLRLVYAPEPKRPGGGRHREPSPSASPTPSRTATRPAPSPTPSPSPSPSASSSPFLSDTTSPGSGPKGSGSKGKHPGGQRPCLDLNLLDECLAL